MAIRQKLRKAPKLDLHVRQVSGDYQSIMSYKCFSGSFYSFLSVLCQRQVCSACMFSIQRPFSLAVTDDEAARVGGHLLCGSYVCAYKE
ncbi:hypothetical protein I7I50_10028 [Histoplasma capsulatum G186AR]|uniref:Uncharacterized protein n=1 Tax=Ajellomyces capsulatus TaxID=5037 RepID=A0A8H8D6Z7_AJECA|nr:hypothetical protein I7I52_01266 [Histoplasma capsulatum]QSS68902.1 hypothetical protein I7I50_10028 [Histoplasma capsulatum G186AR]